MSAPAAGPGIEIAPGLRIPDSELQLHFIRSPGPGGQNVNKVASALQLRFAAATTSLLDESGRRRLAVLAGRRLAQDGWLVLTAHRLRTQEGNRRDAFERLAALITAASQAPKPRKATRPTRASQRRRVEGKLQRQRVKQLRSKPGVED
ncbi:MAG: alternative ribosome rescue aminoacyl-tRNA hydrolase ArfB [Gammaproteobacteria bacterium]